MHKGTENACKIGCKVLNTHVKSCLEIFLLALMFSSEALALSGIGGGRSAKVRNNNGVQAVNAYICANLDCSSSNIKIVEKCANKAHMEHGICMCDDGFIGDGITCRNQNCPEGQKINKDNSQYIPCEANQPCDTCTDPTLPNGDGNGNCVCSDTSCGEEYYCEDGQCSKCPDETPYWNGTQCVECTKNIHCGTDCSYQCEDGICVENLSLMCDPDLIHMGLVNKPDYCDSTNTYHMPVCGLECYNNDEGQCAAGCSDQYPECTENNTHKVCSSDAECKEGWKCAIDNPFGVTGCYEPCAGGKDYWSAVIAIGFGRTHQCTPDMAVCQTNLDCGTDCSYQCGGGRCGLVPTENCRLEIGKVSKSGYCDATNTYHRGLCSVECYNDDEGQCAAGCSDQYPVCTENNTHKVCTSDAECKEGWKCAIDNPFGYKGCYEPCAEGMDYWGMTLPVSHQCTREGAQCITNVDCGMDGTYECMGGVCLLT